MVGKPISEAERVLRFWAKVDKTETCWVWTGARDSKGYGYFGTLDGTKLAHRWSYEHLVGAIPAGLVIDHLCRNTSCVNPEHLEPVTQRENVLRGDAPERMRQMRGGKTECHKGHAFTPENTRTDKRGRRSCRECQRVQDRDRKRAMRAAKRAA